MAKSSTIIAIILALVLGGGGVFVGYLLGNEWMINTNPAQLTPTIDGIIEKKEWLRSSYYNIPFYLDVDNAIDPVVDLANVDGWNYLSVAEDEDYYYLALDLCSDRTNNKDGEWLALHLANRIPDTMGSKLAFYSLEDIGYEYFFYDVDNDVVFSHQLESYHSVTDYADIPIIPEMDTLDVYRGSSSGDFYDFWTYADNKDYTGISSYYPTVPAWSEGEYVALHYGVNITEKMPEGFAGMFTGNISSMYLHYSISSNLTSNPMTQVGNSSQFYSAIYEHGGVPGVIEDLVYGTDVHLLYFDNDKWENDFVTLDHNNINATNGMFYFTILGWNDPDVSEPTNFDLHLDKLSLRVRSSLNLQSIVGNSIGNANYEIAYSYGTSENCAEDHRMFEFKIAKSEFPVLNDEFLYLNVAGYGTMSMENTNYWVYPIYGWPMPPIFYSLDAKAEFIKLDMSIV